MADLPHNLGAPSPRANSKLDEIEAGVFAPPVSVYPGDVPLKFTAADVGFVTAVVPTGANGTTPAIDLAGGRLARIVTPAGWVTSNITFETSYNGTDFAPLYNADGTQYTITGAAAGRAILVPLADFLGVRHLKIVSVISQGANRTLVLALA